MWSESYLAGDLQLDELTLQQDLLFHPSLQNREKGGNFSWMSKSILISWLLKKSMIIEKINSKFMKNRSMLRSLQNYLIQFNKIKSSLKNQTSPRKHKHTRLARSLRFIAYPEKVRWKNIWFLGRKWLLRASHDQKWYQKHMTRKVELQTIYYSNREKARGCRWKLKKKWLPKPQEQLQRAIIMIKTQKLEHVLSYSLHSKV